VKVAMTVVSIPPVYWARTWARDGQAALSADRLTA